MGYFFLTNLSYISMQILSAHGYLILPALSKPDRYGWRHIRWKLLRPLVKRQHFFLRKIQRLRR